MGLPFMRKRQLPIWILILPTIWILHKLYFPERQDARLTHNAVQLERFASRGQLAIELLPPGLSVVGALSRWLDIEIPLLQTSSIFGEVLELVAVQSLLLGLQWKGWIVAVDVLVATATLFTTEHGLLSGIWLASVVVRMGLAFREISQTRNSVVSILSRLTISLAASTFCQTAFVLIATSLLLGHSEVALGGNYNLRFLDAEARREMRPGFSMPKGVSFQDAGPGLHSMTPYSLYIPSAGFLWSDELAWDANYRRFDFAGLGEEQPHPRVVMKDPVGRFTPWIIQKDLANSLNDGLEQDVLMEREPVVVRSVQSKHFLSVTPGPSLIDEALLGALDANETGRFAVEGSLKYDNDTVFEVRDIAEGFRLYHAQRACYLATTFRSFPDHAALKANDSVLHELQSELEVSCVQLASEQASTFYVVEGYQSPMPRPAKWIPPKISHHLKRGTKILSTMQRLHAFRQAYHVLQDTPPELMTKPSRHVQGAGLPTLSWLFSGTLPAMLFGGLMLYKQRTNQSMAFWSSLEGQRLLVIAGVLASHRFGNLSSIEATEYIQCSRCVALVASAVLWHLLQR